MIVIIKILFYIIFLAYFSRRFGFSGRWKHCWYNFRAAAGKLFCGICHTFLTFLNFYTLILLPEYCKDSVVLIILLNVKVEKLELIQPMTMRKTITRGEEFVRQYKKDEVGVFFFHCFWHHPYLLYKVYMQQRKHTRGIQPCAKQMKRQWKWWQLIFTGVSCISSNLWCGYFCDIFNVWRFVFRPLQLEIRWQNVCMLLCLTGL